VREHAFTFLRNRFVAVPLAILAVTAVWNAYIALHDDGRVRGRVVDADGRPVASAVVQMTEQNFTTNVERGQTVTLADGSFAFDDNRSHNIQLRAEKPGLGRSEQRVVRLYFRAQNVVLAEPLVIRPGS